jgi:hypothetical protein
MPRRKWRLLLWICLALPLAVSPSGSRSPRGPSSIETSSAGVRRSKAARTAPAKSPDKNPLSATEAFEARQIRRFHKAVDAERALRYRTEGPLTTAPPDDKQARYRPGSVPAYRFGWRRAAWAAGSPAGQLTARCGGRRGLLETFDWKVEQAASMFLSGFDLDRDAMHRSEDPPLPAVRHRRQLPCVHRQAARAGHCGALGAAEGWRAAAGVGAAAAAAKHNLDRGGSAGDPAARGRGRGSRPSPLPPY